MKRNATKRFIRIFVFVLAVTLGYLAIAYLNPNGYLLSEGNHIAKESTGQLFKEKESEEDEAAQRIKTKKERAEYYFRLLRDPATNSIPKNIRARELHYAKSIPTMQQVQLQRGIKSRSMSALNPGFSWNLAGPDAIGGRTRALGIDQRNHNIIIAGGVSGGIWKSTDGGATWTLRTPNAQNFSVTSLAQDPTNPDTWYYTSGELIGSSASAKGAAYYGTGIFKSTDNGNTWSKIPSTSDTDTQFDTQFDYVSRVVVSPTTGSVFVASNGFGIFRSLDGSDFNDLVLGGAGEHLFVDVAVATDGTLVAALSSTDAGVTPSQKGLFVSNDDGKTWSPITPPSFPSAFDRSIVTFAPSNPAIIYDFTLKNGETSNQGLSFYKIDISGGLPGVAEDRSANLPDFGGSVGGVETQGGYNMEVAVKPDDPDFVILGATNLFRSFDGFATGPVNNSSAEKDKFWIGGYAKSNNINKYPNQHPDQHIIVFDPTNPNIMFSGNDGGIYKTNDVTASSVSWTDKNKGYVVTQFYDASIPAGDNDARLIGGTQDNGTPLFSFDGQQKADLNTDVSSGDGGISFFSKNYIFASNAGISRVIRYATTSDGNITNPFAIVQPVSASSPLFVFPYAVDPNDESIMYYPGSNTLFRNTQIDQINSRNDNGASRGWEQLPLATVSSSYVISAVTVSTMPANVLYYAGSSDSRKPIIKRLDNANTSNRAPVDISIPNAPAGAFVKDIAVNPGNSNDVLVVMSNYNIVGLYHTNDAGRNWKAVEGNLEGDNDPTSPNPGPSLRSASIIPAKGGPLYILATSTGLYATRNLNGDNTVWGREAAGTVGFSVMEDIAARFSDGDIAAASHGRGMFLGKFQGQIAKTPLISLKPASGRAGDSITISAINFQFSSTPSANQVTFDGTPADVTAATPSELTIKVPKVAISPTAKDRSVLVNVANNSGDNPQPAPFTFLEDLGITLSPIKGRTGDKVAITAKNFKFSTTASQNKVFFASTPAEIIQALPQQLMVKVPKVPIDENIEKKTVLVTASNGKGATPDPAPFTILNNPVITLSPRQGEAGDEVIIKAKNFQFSPAATNNDILFGNAHAEVTKASPSQVTVRVPRGAIPANAKLDDQGNYETTVSVQRNGKIPTAKFSIVPPDAFVLSQNYPNPFNHDTTIPLNISQSSRVTLMIYDISGRRVSRPIHDDQFGPGTYNIPVNLANYASGIYIYRIVAKPTSGDEAFVDSKKMTFIK